MAAHAARSEDALSALPFRTSLKEGQFNTAKIKFESGRSMDEVLPSLYTSRKESYSYNPFASEVPMRSALETYMEEEGVGDLLLRHHPVYHDPGQAAAPPLVKLQQEGPGGEDTAMAAAQSSFPIPKKEPEPQTPSQYGLLSRQMSRSDNALPLLRVEPSSRSSKLDSMRSDVDPSLYPLEIGGRKDAAAAALLTPPRTYIHISAKPPLESSRSEDEAFKGAAPTSGTIANAGSWKGTDSNVSSSSKIKFESRRQETRNTPTFPDYNTDYSRRDSSDGSKDNKDSKASHPDNQQQRQRRPHAIEPSPPIKQVFGDRHSSPGVMVDIPWLRTDDIAGLDCVALGSSSAKDWIDESGSRPSPEYSPAGNKSRKVQIAIAPHEESSSSSVTSDSPPSNNVSSEQKRSWMQGNRAKSDRQLLTKNRETIVGRGMSFPTTVTGGVGVVSAEPSGEWWSPSALRQRLDSRVARQSCRTHNPAHDANGMYPDSPTDDMRHAASVTALRNSAFQSSVVQRDLEQELQQGGGSEVIGSRNQRQSQAAATASSTAWQTARPPLKSLETLSAEPILEESEQPDPEDHRKPLGLLRKETVVGRLGGPRSRRNHRVSMPLLEDMPELAQGHVGRTMPDFRAALTAPRAAPQQEPGTDFKSYRTDMAMSKVMGHHAEPAAAAQSPTIQKRVLSMYRNA